jgi:hypothetical protein
VFKGLNETTILEYLPTMFSPILGLTPKNNSNRLDKTMDRGQLLVMIPAFWDIVGGMVASFVQCSGTLVVLDMALGHYVVASTKGYLPGSISTPLEDKPTRFFHWISLFYAPLEPVVNYHVNQ